MVRPTFSLLIDSFSWQEFFLLGIPLLLFISVSFLKDTQKVSKLIPLNRMAEVNYPHCLQGDVIHWALNVVGPGMQYIWYVIGIF